MSDSLFDNAPLGMVEAAALLDLSGEQLATMFIGPFAPDHDGQVSLRLVLQAALLVDLCMLPPDHAWGIAALAAREAVPGGTRLFEVSWMNGEPRAAWTDKANIALLRPTLVIPAENIFTRLAASLADYRSALARRN